MLTIVTSTLQLYRDAFHATGRSLVRGWLVILSVVVFTMLMLLAHQIARPLGMLGGFLLGAGGERERRESDAEGELGLHCGYPRK